MTAPRPQLSYVFAATNSEEVHKVAAWLRENRRTPDAEIVLAAPGRVLGNVPSFVIPRGVVLASAPASAGADRKAIRVAGARVTSGLIVVAVDCDGDIAVRMQEQADSLHEGTRADTADPADWSNVELPRPEITAIAPVRRAGQ